MPIEIHDETPGDAAAVRTLNERAFGQALEVDIVDALRTNGAALGGRPRYVMR
jgi:predicted N-acetyltransferase YhbS